MPKKKKQKSFFSPLKVIAGVGAILVFVVGGLVEDRFTGWGNKMIDDFLSKHQGDILAWVFNNPYNLMRALAVLILILICLDAYFYVKNKSSIVEAAGRKSKPKGEQEEVEEKPKITLNDFGFERKHWTDRTHTVNAYIDISNQPQKGSVNFKGLYPTIVWKNNQGNEVDKNNGRWAIPNEDRNKMKVTDMQSVDLDANGQPRRLYFTTDNREGKLYSWWRSWDGHDKSQLITDSPAYVVIELQDKQALTARFRFKISHSEDSIAIERVNNKNRPISSSKEFKYEEGKELSTESNTEKKRLKYSIGIEVQRFKEKFGRIHFAPVEARNERYNEAKGILDTKITDFRYQANMILADTHIPRLLSELSNFFQQYWVQMGYLSASREEHTGWIKGQAKVPPELIKDIKELETKIDKSINQINAIVEKLIELCKE